MNAIATEIVLFVMLVLTVIVVEARDLIASVIELSLVGLMLVFLLYQLKAPDVALSAVVVGALVVGLFLFTIEEVSE